MKNSFLQILNFRTMFALIFVVMSTFFFACSDDDDELGLAPTVSLSSPSGSGIVGATVATTVTLTASEGLKSFSVLKNGAIFDTETYPTGDETATYQLDYVIEDLAAGSIVTFTFVATDQVDRASNIATFTVTVTAIPPKEVVTVEPGSYYGTINWTADKIYLLKGFVRIGKAIVNVDPTAAIPADSTGVLNIEEGTLIFGDKNTKGTLIIQRGSKINAIGTATNPIIMTSGRPAGQREPGDWGGLVICGRADNNQGDNIQLEGGYGGWHGGDLDNDNSGELKYIRIEFAGIPINPNEEVNSLTMGSVGSATKIDYIMCSYGLDDAFEWFGGTVSSKYLIAYRGLDDDFDVDFGYRGNVQFGIGIRDFASADQSGSNGFEVDNDGQGSTKTPFTSGVFSNMTIIGPKATRETAIDLQFQNAMHLRRTNKLKIYNSFFTAYTNGLFVDGSTTQANAASGDLQLRNIILAGVDNWGGNGYGSAGTIFTTAPANGAQHGNNPRGFAVRDQNTATPPADIFIGGEKPSVWFAAQYGNQLMDKWQDANIDPSIFETGVPKVTPNTGSVLLNKNVADLWNSNTTENAYFEKVNYLGAFGTTDWSTGWAEWLPKLADYK
jgi:hypothetical protein